LSNEYGSRGRALSRRISTKTTKENERRAVPKRETLRKKGKNSSANKKEDRKKDGQSKSTGRKAEGFHH